MRVGIVGNGSDKFTELGEYYAKQRIRSLLKPGDTVVSGHSPVGGIDIWAEEIGAEIGCDLDIKEPRQHSWHGEYGYRARNLDIARSSDVVHVILADAYPDGYTGRVFKLCYHCKKDDHVKSGGCWTGIKAQEAGIPAVWHIVGNEEV